VNRFISTQCANCDCNNGPFLTRPEFCKNTIWQECTRKNRNEQ